MHLAWILQLLHQQAGISRSRIQTVDEAAMEGTEQYTGTIPEEIKTCRNLTRCCAFGICIRVSKPAAADMCSLWASCLASLSFVFYDKCIFWVFPDKHNLCGDKTHYNYAYLSA